MEVIGYHIGGSVLICIGATLLLFVFIVAIVVDSRRPGRPKMGKIFEEDEDEEEDDNGMWIISEE